MYLLDTNHMSELIQQNAALIRRANERGRDVGVCTTVIVRGELIFMAAKSDRVQQNRQEIEQLLSRVPVHAIDPETADWYGTLKARLIDRFGPKEKAKRRRATLAQIGLSDNDLWIAACAKRHGLVVVSVDSDFRRIQDVTDLQVESWL